MRRSGRFCGVVPKYIRHKSDPQNSPSLSKGIIQLSPIAGGL